jgi:AbrB family looped-hinge helix DNA binding protein
MPHLDLTSTRVASGGRIVIPASYRKALGIKTGDEVVVQLEEGAVRVFSRDEALRRLQEKVTGSVPRKVSLAAELIRERRKEARRE